MARFGRVISSVMLAAVTLISMFSALPAQAAQSKINPTEIDAIANRVLDLYSVPGVAVGLIQNGKVVYTKGYGFADFEKKRPVTEQTEFAIGSISKSFTALDIAQLVDAGKIDLDAPVISYLPDFKLADPDATKTLTVRQVISHSSGLPRADERLALTLDSRKQLVGDLINIPLTAKPGKTWQYSNQNFVLAGYLVEQITGQTWEAYTQTHILQALGMKATAPDMDSLLNAADHAQPYEIDVLKTVNLLNFTPEQKKVFKVIAPAGTITSNVVDMSQYALFQLGDGTFNGKQIVSKKLLDELHTRQIGVGGMAEGNALLTLSLTQDIGYGMGWFTESYQGHKLISHGGEIAGYTANVTLAPDDQTGIVLLSNLNTTVPFIDSLRLSLLANMLGLKSDDIPQQVAQRFNLDPASYKQHVAAAKSFKLDTAALNKFVGNYTGVAGPFTIQLVNGSLHVILGPQNVELIPYAENSFLANTTLGITISFKFEGKDQVTVYQDGTEIGKRQNGATSEYKDPKGRFTVTIPNGLVATQTGDLGVIQTTTPPGTFVLAAADATAADLKTEVQNWLVSYKQITTEQPVNVRDIPLNGVPWTQYVYTASDGQLLVVVAAKQGNTAYFISAKCKSSDIAALTPAFNELVLSFKITPAQP